MLSSYNLDMNRSVLDLFKTVLKKEENLTFYNMVMMSLIRRARGLCPSVGTSRQLGSADCSTSSAIVGEVGECNPMVSDYLHCAVSDIRCCLQAKVVL